MHTSHLLRNVFPLTLVALAMLTGRGLLGAGLEVGARLGSYPPKHLTGPDKGSRQCPPCKYAGGPFVQIFISTESDATTQALAQKLESLLAARANLRGVVVLMDETRKPDYETWAKDWKLEKTGLCYVLTGNRGTVARDYNLEGATNVLIVSDEKKVVQSIANAGVEDLERAVKVLRE